MDADLRQIVLGCATSSAPVFSSCSQAKPCVTTVTTPLRSVSAASPEIRKLGPSPVSQAFTPQKRVTLDWNKKRTDIFCEGNIAKSPENLSKQPHGAQVTRRLDFFYTMSASSTGASSSLNRR